MEPGETRVHVEPEDGFYCSVVEAPRGELVHSMYVRDGRIWRYHVCDPSFRNWFGMCHAVPGNVVPDFPLINKSFGLSYSGNDL
jgi:Ni,Fe-hydrogenase III large subunit